MYGESDRGIVGCPCLFNLFKYFFPPFDVNDVAIARAVIQMAQSLDMEVIAEGVETREHLKLLHSLNCNKIQGYVVSKPLPPEEVEVFLNKEWRFAVEGMDLKGQMGNIISM